MAKQRLLCITAHPDDEADFGGSLLLYGSRGVETYVVCLTPGQAASHRGGYLDDASLVAARQREFAASCQLLKVTHGEVLDYPDSRLDRLDLYSTVAELVQRVRRIRPQVVITFGPEGGVTAHTDHSMASVFATMAYHWAGRTNRYSEQLQNGLQPWRAQKLYYATADFTRPERQPVSLAPQTAVVEIGEYFETKIRAFNTHTTQEPLFSRFETHVRRRGSVEMFHLAASVHPEPMRHETDLFDGVQLD